jgi:septal ring factor EnvC (AmiA/AmiB activator)
VLNNLVENQEKYKNLKRRIENDIAEKEQVIIEKEKEQALLNERKIEQEKLIVELNYNQRNLEREIDKKRIAEVQIKEMIATLIEEERERERKIREDRLKGISNPLLPRYNFDSFENFSELKGNLNWPVLKGEIVRNFGENENEKLKTVTLNYGIDVSTEKNSNVYAVAEGVVSAIDWIPGYGSIIIITHKGNYRTVYGHVSDIKVTEGEIVQGGLLLGTVSQSLEGNIIHFEVWEERNYLDPGIWLAKE